MNIYAKTARNVISDLVVIQRKHNRSNPTFIKYSGVFIIITIVIKFGFMWMNVDLAFRKRSKIVHEMLRIKFPGHVVHSRLAVSDHRRHLIRWRCGGRERGDRSRSVRPASRSETPGRPVFFFFFDDSRDRCNKNEPSRWRNNL